DVPASPRSVLEVLRIGRPRVRLHWPFRDHWRSCPDCPTSFRPADQAYFHLVSAVRIGRGYARHLSCPLSMRAADRWRNFRSHRVVRLPSVFSLFARPLTPNRENRRLVPKRKIKVGQRLFASILRVACCTASMPLTLFI